MPTSATNVPASVAGYLLQIQRALWRLADAPLDAAVGVETCDDVATLTPDGLMESEQDKLTLSALGSPLSNRSEDLWKTLRIWCNSWKNNKHTGRELKFFFVTNRNCVGSVLKLLCSNDRPEETDKEVLAALKAEAKHNSAPAKGSLQDLINTVVEFGDDVLLAVISATIVQSGPGFVDSDLVDKTISRLHVHPAVECSEVYRSLLGWMVEILLNKWKAGEEGWVQRSEFDSQLGAITQTLLRHKICARASRVIPVSADDKDDARQHRFLLHLSLIEMDEQSIDQELIHYVQFNREKLRLLDEGAIIPNEWEYRGDRLWQL